MIRTLTLFAALFLLSTSCAQDKNDVVITFKTPYGEMVAILYDETPQHKANFIKLAKEHYFDSTLFHRVIQGFMIQGGDPTSKAAKPGERLGSGGPAYMIPPEFKSNLFHEKGALSAARTDNPAKESSGSQFYIVQGTVISTADLESLKYDQQKLMTGLRKMFEMPDFKPLLDSLNTLYFSGDMPAYQKRLFELAPRVEKVTGISVIKPVSAEKMKIYATLGGAPHLDGEYTVFGKVIKGLEVIDKIAAVQRDEADRPLEDVRMFVTAQEMSRKKITKEFGYVYPPKQP